ncbi:MAG: NAD-dependent DNA ligase LigA [Chitinophagales bacterium]|nr:NAD-dependent DNA ligase LigA [Chitinophagales bacterium]HQU40768.1 NAD-dependent DNA ligase LigA [Chitinophagales bacterium]HQU77267.1 NAD-dependent DNA ligase LigA [Chitinophagales bacterium]HRX24565.1 NAD-dependent DNA ligase LigA [Chitinophagales bacterium]
MKYAASQQQELSALTRKLLQEGEAVPGKESEATQTASSLRQVIIFHDWKYYVQADNIITDFEYDLLFRRLKAIEAAYPSLVTPDSPTQRVARDLTEDFPSVTHSVPMLSLDNSYNIDDLIDWDARVKGFVGDEEVIYCVEPKFDGGSIALLYENDILVRAATRGDGTTGEEITNNARRMRSVPLRADFSSIGLQKVELRGEVVINKQTFADINRKREEEGLNILQNPRNSAAGALRVKDAEEVSRRGLEAFIYAIGFAVDVKGENQLGDTLQKHFDNIEWLGKLGFKVPVQEKKRCKGIQEVMDFINEWEARRDDFAYEIDGMVIKVDDLKQQQLCGFTAHHPRWAIAFKFKAREAATELEGVEFQVGRTGAITPVAKVKPVYIGGVTVSSISLHNLDIIREKDIRLGDTVIVQRAGDVIPYIDRVVLEKRSGKETSIDFPDGCPSCGAPIHRPEGEAVFRCSNIECPAQAEERLIHFVSKGAMDMDGLGRETVIDFFRRGWLKSIPDIYRLPYEEILSLEGWKEKSVNKLRESIEASKQQPLWRLVNGFGIRHVGTQTAKDLVRHLDKLTDLFDYDAEKLTEIEGIGQIVASSITEFFHNPGNRHMITELETLGLNLVQEKQAGGGKLEGKTFLFTGSLTRFTRDQAKEMVEANGGRILSSVSANLHYLVAGEKAGSKLKKAEAIPSIQVIDEEQFLQMIA